MNLSGRFNQAPVEKKRYLVDYTLQLAEGETIVGCVPTVSSPTDLTNTGAFTVSGVAIVPAGNQVTYFVTGGTDQTTYNISFVATTSIGQIFEDVVEYNIKDKSDA